MFSSLVRQIVSHQTSKNAQLGVCVCRHYARPLIRRPIRVYGADGQELTGEEGRTTRPPQRTQAQRVEGGEVEGQPTYKEWEETILGGLKYVKLTEKDKSFKRLLEAASRRKARERHRLVVLEGRRLVADALDAGAVTRGLYFSKLENLQGLDLTPLEGRLYRVTPDQLKHVSGVTTPPGIMALCEMPTSSSLKINEAHHCPITLICDNIRDPGNMGTLLRSAAAVGCHKILVTKGNVDIWDPKVLRAGAGCHFRTHIRHNVDWATVPGLISADCRFHLAENLHTPSTDDRTSRGSDSDTDSDSDTESRIHSDVVAHNNSELLNATEASGLSHLQTDHLRTDFDVNHDSEQLSVNGLPLVEALSADLVSSSWQEVVLVVGGETKGLSREAWDLARSRGGRAVFLPMTPGVDSLNAAMAGTVLLYELRRQLRAIQYSEKDV